ncbi:MAG: glutathionylspermidine synthase family protein [Alphaproteobacteria bacterium]|nr:glutathionylspermidine synthase family protein [Alphaproteobacteria bacterium]
MQRQTITPRSDWRERVEALGFDFHTIDGKPYWDETACYRFSAAEIDQIDDATAEMERLCFGAVERVIEEELYDRLGIPEQAWPLITESWRRGDRNIVGRFDIAWNGTGDPKLLEYNADTPTALFEASVVQWDWLESARRGADQFNSIHEKLTETWQRYGIEGRVHFTCVRDHAEDYATTTYLRDTCLQAGHDTAFLYIDEVGWNGLGFVDGDDAPVTTLFKLYPWEWLINETFAEHIGPSRIRMIEPAWKMILSNKAILALLWETFEGHRNLMPASFDPADIDGGCVEKPVFGREGQGVKIHAGGTRQASPGMVYQALAPLYHIGGRHAVIGSWVIASQPAGIGIREDDGPITVNTSRFVPHFFE